MANIARGMAGSHVLLLGNEAFARGALEAGVQVCASYAGTPSTEIMQSLIDSAKDLNIHVEWSVNEKLAVEVAAAAAMSGLRSLASMKNAGLSVALDALMHLNLSGVGEGAMVVIVCDDPQAHSSGDEMDTRHIAEIADVPLLEPSNSQEAKEMVRWAFDLSDRFKVYCILRGHTRLSHSRGGVELGEIPRPEKKAKFDTCKLISPYANALGEGYPSQKHAVLHEKQIRMQALFESSPFNPYSGPERPELIIVCSGSGWPCSIDAIEALGLTESVGILKIGTLWPFPEKLIERHLKQTSQVLVVEEVDPFLENHVKERVAESSSLAGSLQIHGKWSGHLNYFGEITPDLVIKALCKIFHLDYHPRERSYEQKAQKASKMIISRALAWCPGCPHRATFFALGNARKENGRHPIVVGDIGCYTIDQWGGGSNQTNACLGMGSGAGLACGFGQLSQFGLDQPSIGICGDSTFYHASIPALINAVFNKSNMALIVLDNGATAMTGFQPHPGSGQTATGGETKQLKPEEIARACGVECVEVVDPFDLKETTKAIEKAIAFDGPSVVVSRRTCALVAQREESRIGQKTIPYLVDQDKCSECALNIQNRVMPCGVACPAGNDIPAFLSLAKQGRFKEGLELIKQSNPLPAVLGRACYHPCESECNRGGFDEAIAIHTVERFLGDFGIRLPRAKPRKSKKKEKVGVVGSGPAGLTCAYNLARMGYPVTIFESLSVPGGMLAVGIPEYRLPREILRAEIKNIEDLGVEIRLNSPIQSVSELLDRGYKAIFIGTGAHKDVKLNIPGGEKEGMLAAAKFLRDANLGKPVTIGDNVVVVGGGNSAIDSARVAARTGAKRVSMIYRRSRAEMPSTDEEVKAAEEEGIGIVYQVAPIKILGDGKVTGLECLRTRLGKPDKEGRARPIPIKGSEFSIDADTVIAAIGQTSDLSFVDDKLEISPTGTLLVDVDSLATSEPGIFAGGDVVTGPSNVAKAIGAGKKAATSIDRFLRGKPLSKVEEERPVVSFEELNLGCVPKLRRPRVSTLPGVTRIRGFDEVESGFTQDMALAEAIRCLSCGPNDEKCIALLKCPAIIRDHDGNPFIASSLCNGCGVCADVCPYGAIAEEEVR